jgi:hypothetical protein
MPSLLEGLSVLVDFPQQSLGRPLRHPEVLGMDDTPVVLGVRLHESYAPRRAMQIQRLQIPLGKPISV